jgi:PhoPQ-activated pathogenicity-related protein
MTHRRQVAARRTPRSPRASILLALAALTLGGTVGTAREPASPRTPLDDYIAKPDSSYSWKVVKTSSRPGMRVFVLEMVSQKWRTAEEVDRPIWRHWMTVACPEKLTSTTGFLLIGGGRNGGDPPDGPAAMVIKIAQATGTVVTELKMVPNQPLIFHNDGQRRSEDDLIGYTWDQFFKTGDPTWPARNPMAKSAVRAMDTITQLLASESGGERTVDRFVVAGGSKRGWTTWITAAVDKRVVAIVPIVIDVLNVRESMRHHYEAYGFWAPSIGDYVQHGVTQRMDDPRMVELCRLVDPYSYRKRLTMPKLLVCAAGDQFFLPDSSRFYFDDLVGPKYLRYVPNGDHSLDGTDAIESIIAFYWTVLRGKQLPRFSWAFQGNDTIRVHAVDRPERVTLWQATNPRARDFRLESLGPKYTSRVLADQGEGNYVATVPAPEEGWTAMFVELLYDVGAPTPAKFTTSVRVVPDVLPFAGADLTKPATISIRCNAPEGAIAAAIEHQLAEYFGAPERAAVIAPWLPGATPADVGPVASAKTAIAAAKSADRGRVTRSDRSLELRLRPTDARLRETAEAVTAWLKKMGCTDFAYAMHSGME